MKIILICLTVIGLNFSTILLAEGAIKYRELANKSAALGDYRQAIQYLNIAMNQRWSSEPKTPCITDNSNEQHCVDLPGIPNMKASWYIHQRAKLYILLEDYNNAINDYISLNEVYEVGLIYDKFGHTEEAKEYFEKAYNENKCQDPKKKFKKYNLKVGFFDCMFKD